MASKKTRLRELLAQHQPPVIDPAFFSLLQQELHPISTAYLRRLLLQADAPLHPLVEGVRLDTFRHFCRSLFLLNETPMTRASPPEMKMGTKRVQRV